MKLTKRKGFNFFRSYYDVYNELSDKDKVQFMDALLDRQFLGVKPTSLKGMAKFAYISQTNSIDSQVKGYEDKVGIKLNPNPRKGGVVGVNETILTPSLQVEEKEKEKEKEKVEEQDVKIFSFHDSLIDYGFKENLVNDWLLVRKTKKATNTETAYNAFIKEIEKKPCDINEILALIISKDWKGFKWTWLDEEKSSDKKENVFTQLEAEYNQIAGNHE